MSYGYGEPLDLIEKAKADGRTKLDLSYRGLTSVPAELWQLTNLTRLDLSVNQLTSVPAELGQLTNLTTLDLSRNQLTSVPAELGQLTNLTTLDLSRNQLTSVPAELGQLTNLTTLDLRGNQLTSVPAELGQLANLTELDLGSNRLTSVPAELGQLTNLRELYLGDNQLTSVPPELGQLTKLEVLDLRANRIQSLPKELLDLPIDLTFGHPVPEEKAVFLKGNPLTNPPVEVLRQGKDAVRRWFEALEAEGEERLNEVKVLLVGYGGAGKTSVVRRLTTGKFKADEVKTHGVRIKRWPLKMRDEHVTVHLWDYGGQGIMQATHRVFFSHRTLYVLVIDARQESDPEEWLSNIETMGGDSPVLVVVNKIDEHVFGLNETGLRKRYANIKGFYHVSCKTGDGIDLLKRDLPGHVGLVEMTRMTWPRRHAAVKERLGRLRRDYIRYSDYQTICQEEHVYDRQRQRELITVLHELGAMLYFPDPHLQDTQVLNPEWVTGGIYKIINSPALKEFQGKLPRDKLDYVLNQERLPDETQGLLGKRRQYTPTEQTYIVELMNKFGLCYELGDHTILVPDLLTEQEQAKGLPERVDLRFYFEYDFLPALVMPRFMVKSSDDLVPVLCWRTGAVLKNEALKAVAVVRKDARRRRISVEVTSSRPRDYLATVRKTIWEINREFTKLDVTEWVPLPGTDAHAVKYLDLIGHEAGRRPEKFVGELGKGFSVAKLLGSIESPEETRKRIQEATGAGGRYFDFRSAQVEGDILMDRSEGKKTEIGGDVMASALGDGAKVRARDINVIKQNIDNATALDEKDRAILKQAADALEKLNLGKGDRRDAEYHLDQIVDELNKPRPEPSRLKKLWTYFNENAPGIAAILSAIQLIAQAMPQ